MLPMILQLQFSNFNLTLSFFILTSSKSNEILFFHRNLPTVHNLLNNNLSYEFSHAASLAPATSYLALSFNRFEPASKFSFFAGEIRINNMAGGAGSSSWVAAFMVPHEPLRTRSRHDLSLAARAELSYGPTKLKARAICPQGQTVRRSRRRASVPSAIHSVFSIQYLLKTERVTRLKKWFVIGRVTKSVSRISLFVEMWKLESIWNWLKIGKFGIRIKERWIK